MTHVPSISDCLEARRARLRGSFDAYGIDFVEFLRQAPPVLRLHLLGRMPDNFSSGHLRFERQGRACSLKIEQLWLPPDGDDQQLPPRPRNCVDIQLDRSGDDLEYVLKLVEPAVDEAADGIGGSRSPAIDPYLGSATFRFRPQATGGADCQPSAPLPASAPVAPTINYLAKDYASFRQVLLDRLAVTLPEWRERSAADIGVTLVELLAYEADRLSYYQDAVATEAYLDTCRLRKSLRRHARLIDYRIHQGCNARTWIQVEIDREASDWHPRDVFFVALRRQPPEPLTGPLRGETLANWLDSQFRDQVAVFEPLSSETIHLRRAHNRIELYDWLGAEPCLRAGATSATLRGRLPGCRSEVATDVAAAAERHDMTADRDLTVHRDMPVDAVPELHLAPGDILILEEIRSPLTGSTADADPEHRHAVQLCRVEASADPLTGTPLVRVHWSRADALPFLLWIRRPEVSAGAFAVARGNVILSDHGFRAAEVFRLQAPQSVPVGLPVDKYPPRRVTGKLVRGPITHGVPLSCGTSAAEMIRQDPRQAVPQLLLRRASDERLLPLSFCELAAAEQFANRIWLEVGRGGRLAQRWRAAFPRTSRLLARQRDAAADGLATSSALPAQLRELSRRAVQADLRELAWQPRSDLLQSTSLDPHFVLELDNEDHAELRFGDGQQGLQPDDGCQVRAEYRIGNGAQGNVAADAITYLGFYRTAEAAACRIRNPLPARGGVEPESAEEIRLSAPRALRLELQRAISEEDYEQLTLRLFGDRVQRAKATRRWTGHEFEVLVAIDPWNDQLENESLPAAVERQLRKYRRIGHSVRVALARRVPLRLDLRVCVKRHFHFSQVRAALHELFSSRTLASGAPAFFHPDRITFGDGLYVSRIVAAAGAVAGVRSAQVTRLSPLDVDDDRPLDTGVMRLGPQVIARLDNDPAHPQHGQVHICEAQS